MSDSKGLNFLSSEPTEIGEGLALSVEAEAEAEPVNGWYNVPVNVIVTGGAVGGTVRYSIDGAAFQDYTGRVPIPTEPAGAHVVTAIDVVPDGTPDGKITDLQVIYVAVDKTAPTLKITQAPEPNAQGFSDRAVTVTVEADDQFGSGVFSLTAVPSGGTAVVDGDPSPGVLRFTWDQEGETTFAVTATDAAGNTSRGSLVLNIDTSAPVVTVENEDGSNFTDEWVQDPVSVKIVATDTGSGVIKTTYTRTTGVPDPAVPIAYVDPFTVGEGQTVITGFAENGAGLVGQSDPVLIKVDETDPTLTLTRSPAGSPVTVTVVADDEGGSDITSVTYSLDGDDKGAIPDDNVIDVPEGATSVTVTVTDGAGRTATASIDVGAPTATLTAPDTSPVGGTASVGYLCADDGVDASGIASCTLTVNGAPVALDGDAGTVEIPTPTTGNYALVLTATDGDDNVTTATANISTVYGICLDYNPNQGKRIGSNYTIKFTLCDGTNNLSSPDIILTAISVTDATGVERPPGPNFQGSSNAGFEFRFTDPGYTYNLDTTGLPYIAPGDYTLDFVVGAADPDTGEVDPGLFVYSAPFKLRR